MADTTPTVNPSPGLGDTRTVPDPSVLTTQQLNVGLASLRELIMAEFSIRDQRFNGMDKALELLQRQADKVPSETDLAVERLEQLNNEKFKSIEIQFKERDTRIEQASIASKSAIDTAFQAAKEAVKEQNNSNILAADKSEKAFTKQIDQMTANINTQGTSFDGKITDIKDRIALIERNGIGLVGAATTRLTSIESHAKGVDATWAIIATLIFLIIGVIGLGITIATMR